MSGHLDAAAVFESSLLLGGTTHPYSCQQPQGDSWFTTLDFGGIFTLVCPVCPIWGEETCVLLLTKKTLCHTTGAYYTWVRTCHSACVGVRGQLVGADLLLRPVGTKLKSLGTSLVFTQYFTSTGCKFTFRYESK